MGGGTAGTSVIVRRGKASSWCEASWGSGDRKGLLPCQLHAPWHSGRQQAEVYPLRRSCSDLISSPCGEWTVWVGRLVGARPGPAGAARKDDRDRSLTLCCDAGTRLAGPGGKAHGSPGPGGRSVQTGRAGCLPCRGELGRDAFSCALDSAAPRAHRAGCRRADGRREGDAWARVGGAVGGGFPALLFRREGFLRELGPA